MGVEPIRLFGAGSLREALSEIARDFEALSGQPVQTTFGPSGILRERIERGEFADVFASANMKHAQMLAGAGISGAVMPFAGNRLCLLARRGVDIDGRDVLDVMLDPGLRLGMSTPGSDPAGDYTRLMFKRAGALRPGAFEALRAKALTLTGGAASEKPPAGRNLYAWILDSGRADVFITYRTNVLAARRDNPELAFRETPAKLAVDTAYGLTVIKSASPAAQDLADHILGPKGREVLDAAGFTAP